MHRSHGTSVGAACLPDTRYLLLECGRVQWVVSYIGVTAWQPSAGLLPGSGRPPYTSLVAVQVRGSRLYIFQASPVDAGEYVCRAGNGQEATITVKVTGNQGANFAYRE